MSSLSSANTICELDVSFSAPQYIAFNLAKYVPRIQMRSHAQVTIGKYDGWLSSEG